MKENLVKQIANSMRDVTFVRDCILNSKNRHPFQPIPWNSLSLSHGYPSLLLLFGVLDNLFPQENWDAASHQCVLMMKEEIESTAITDFSLFGGLAGCCFALQGASKNNTRYTKLLSKLNSCLFEGIREKYFFSLREKIDLKLPARAELYDVISGITGIGAYALSNSTQQVFEDLLRAILDVCILLIRRKIPVGPHHVYGWYLPYHYQFLEEDKKNYPKGNFNLGIAHGISGLVAFLSIASLRGICQPGQKEAIEIGAEWVNSKKKTWKGRLFWTDRISFEEEVQENPQNSPYFTMDAWCYGTAGVARSLYLAGKALNKAEYLQISLEAFLDIFSRPQLPSPTFCHGQAGLFILTQLMARDTGSISLEQQLSHLEERLLGCYQKEYPFGFRDEEPLLQDQLFFLNQQAEPYQTIGIDKGGILDGVAGILLSLLFHKERPSKWIDLFLIEDKT